VGRNRARWWLGAAAILVASFAVYAPALEGGFVWDDDTHLLDNPVLEENGLRKVWLTPPQRINYWPLTFTTYWVEHQLWGLDPLGYHVVNVLIHAASCILIWLVLLRLRVPYPWLVALVFAIHPVNVESVAWITQRKNLLSMFFFALALLLHLRFEDRRSVTAYVLAIGSFLAAMLSKGAAAPLPAVLLLCAWWRRGEITRTDLWRTLPFFAVAVVASTMEFSTQNVVAAAEVVRDDGFLTRLAGSGWVCWFYLWKAVLPIGLSFVYPRWVIDPSLPQAWLPLLGALVLLGAAWSWRRGWGRPVFFALVYYGLLLSPVLGFFDIYYMRFSYVADHYQYLALVGIVALEVGGLGSLLRRARVPRALPIALAAGWVGAFAITTSALSASYRGEEILWRATLQNNPDAFLAHYNLAHLLHDEGRLEEAAHHYREVVRIRPNHAWAHNNLGKVVQDRGDAGLAIEYYGRAVALDPDFFEAHNNLAVLLAEQGRAEEARSHYQTALQIAPDSAAVHYNLARLLEQLGRLDQALGHYQSVLALDPQARHARAGIARVHAARARSQERGKGAQRAGPERERHP
jgi:tetratricopeptide (TPR) repeat protein